jgi:hypothetical protein
MSLVTQHEEVAQSFVVDLVTVIIVVSSDGNYCCKSSDGSYCCFYLSLVTVIIVVNLVTVINVVFI